MSQYTEYQQGYTGGFGSGRVTWAVQRLILLNGLVFAAQLVLDPAAAAFGWGGSGAPGGIVTLVLGFQPGALLYGMVWKPITYQFLHHGLLHLLMNMLWLFFFGPDVERSMGTRAFYRFYLACGALGVMATFVPLVLWGASTSVIGASGAVMGVLVAFAMVDPERQIYLFPIPTPLNARIIVFLVLGMNLLSAYSDPGGNVSVATHLGGMATGYLMMKALPAFNRWQHQRARAAKPAATDPVGDAVDNIFKFKDRGRH